MGALKVEFILSTLAEQDNAIIKTKDKRYSANVKEFGDDVENRPYDMIENNYKPQRYHTHTLDETEPEFPYGGLGYLSTRTFNINNFKSFRIIWKVVYNTRDGVNKVNRIDELPGLKEKCERIIKSADTDNILILYIERFCVEYHHGRITEPSELVKLLLDKIKDCLCQHKYPFLSHILDYRNEHPELFE